MYHAQLGEFMQRDPVADDTSVNKYQCVSSNPANFVDPDGAQTRRRQLGQPDQRLIALIKKLQAKVKGLSVAAARSRCCDWAKKQINDLAWTQGLPACPCRLPTGAEAKKWTDPAPAPMHENALCIRNEFTDIVIRVPAPPGQQCCYDEVGRLYTNGPKAGTPDKIAPFNVHDLAGAQHGIADLLPFLHCEKAGLIDVYLYGRPINNANNCPENPPDPAPIPPLEVLCNDDESC